MPEWTLQGNIVSSAPQKTQVICHENKNYRGQVERKQHDDSNWPLNRGGYLCESKLILRFCNSLITKHSHGDTGIKAKNSVLKQAKMVSIYQKNNTADIPKEIRNNQSSFPAKIPVIYKEITLKN